MGHPPTHPQQPGIACLSARASYIGHKARLHLLFTQVLPEHVGQRWSCLHVLETGKPVLRVHGEELQGDHPLRQVPQKNGHLPQVGAALEGFYRYEAWNLRIASGM